MNNQKLVTIFWSGGWDGTFRMLQLAQLDVIVQPVYITDPMRGSVEYEKRAIEQILNRLRESARAQLLDVIFFETHQVYSLCADADISAAYRELSDRYRLGSQYEWMALLANKLGIVPEVGVENEEGSHARATLLGEGCIEDGRFVANRLGSAADNVMSHFSFPVINLSKREMQAIAEENGWMDILKLTWFCHHPIDGQPCGLCGPCNDIMNYGMAWRMPDVSAERWKNREALLGMANPGIPSIVKRISEHSTLYKRTTGHDLDLLHPRDLNEKLQWLMVYKYDRNVSGFADKLAVREYVKECGYPDILTIVYGVWKRGAEVDISVLPDKYVLKCNHGSGDMFYALCNGKTGNVGQGEAQEFDLKTSLEKLDKALSYDYARVGYEYHYSYIEPKLYAEELLENADGSPLTDYKFFCFGGVPKFVKVISDRASGKHQDYYDMDWSFRPLVKDEISMGGGMPKPLNFDRMKQIAADLSKPFPMARVDLYNVDGRICFGEITLTPATGLNRTDKPETLEMFGGMIEL